MNTPREFRRRARMLFAALAVLAASVGATALTPASPAQAAPARAAQVRAAQVQAATGTGTAAVTVSPGTADPDYATTLTLHGSGFQPLAGGWGGIYVFFGTVSGTWQPSKGGVSGVDYLYVPDTEAKDNNGYEKFVSYQDGGTLSAANGGIINPDGTWSTALIVPGAKFKAVGREGAPEEVDCLRVQCGVITIGAHGVVDDRNETFTPVSFAVPGTTNGSGPTQTAAVPAKSAPAQAAPSASAVAVPAASQTPAPTERAVAAEGFHLSSISTPWWILGAAVLVALIALIAGLVSVGRARGKGRTS
ncbi:MAG TPA: hypothetical protein VGC45_07970 [Gryllotalpicola sp.]